MWGILEILVFFLLAAIIAILAISKNKALTISDNRNVEVLSKRKIALTMNEADNLAKTLALIVENGKPETAELTRKENPKEIVAFVIK